MGRKKKNTSKNKAVVNEKSTENLVNLSTPGNTNDITKPADLLIDSDPINNYENKAAKKNKSLEEAKQKKLIELETVYSDIPNNLKLTTSKDIDGNEVELQLDSDSIENLYNIPLVLAIKKYKNGEFSITDSTSDTRTNRISSADEIWLRSGKLPDRIKDILQDEVIKVRDKENNFANMKVRDILNILNEIKNECIRIQANKNNIIAELQVLDTLKEVKKFDIFKDFH